MQAVATPDESEHRASLRLACFVQGPHAPSSRFRVLQYLPKLQQLGIEADVFSVSPGPAGWTVRWLPGPLYHLTRRATQLGVYVPRRYLQLRRAALEHYDAVFVQKQLSPVQIGPRLEQCVASRNPRIIFDVDDAIFGSGGSSSRAFRYFEAVCRLSRCVIAGNNFLAEHVPSDVKVTILPTTVDEDRFTPAGKTTDSAQPVCIGWTGTGSNLRYLVRLKSVFQQLSAEGVRLRVICNRVNIPELTGIQGLECIRWNEQSEVEDLQVLDIGIMPLADTTWTRGKCAFKLVQYMALGIPAVASPVGANNEVLVHGKTGLFADSLESWRAALIQLVRDAEMRRAMGRAAREHYLDTLSLSGNAARMADTMRRVAAS